MYSRRRQERSLCCSEVRGRCSAPPIESADALPKRVSPHIARAVSLILCQSLHMAHR